MSERKKSRLALIGLVLIALVGSLAFYLGRPGDSNASQALDKAKAVNDTVMDAAQRQRSEEESQAK